MARPRVEVNPFVHQAIILAFRSYIVINLRSFQKERRKECANRYFGTDFQHNKEFLRRESHWCKHWQKIFESLRLFKKYL